MTTRGVILAALLLALGRPSWWLLGLAGFLTRGGIAVFVLAIVTLPSPLALSNILAPFIVPLAFGTLLPQTAVLFGATALLGLLWLALGSWFGAASEVALIRDAGAAAEDEGFRLGAREPAAGEVVGGRGGRRMSGRVAVARLIAHLPTFVAVAVGGVAIVAVTYRELITPSDGGPIQLRVIAGALAPIGVIVVLWLLGEIVGGHAARRLVLDRASVARAVGAAVADLARHPIRMLLAPLVLTIVLGIDLAGLLAVVIVVLGDAQDRLTDARSDPVAVALVVSTLGAAWCLALIVTGLIASWRGAAMTLDRLRSLGPNAIAAAGEPPGPADHGTIGASTHRRPGDRSRAEGNGRLDAQRRSRRCQRGTHGDEDGRVPGLRVAGRSRPLRLCRLRCAARVDCGRGAILGVGRGCRLRGDG